MTNPELSDFERLVLTELFIWSQSSDSVVSIESIKQMLEDGGEEASAREISLALGLLRRLDLVKRYDSSANREKKFWAISNAGQSNVFDTNKKTPLLKANAKATAGQEISNPQAVHSTLYVPAADRYVAAQDNQPAIAEMRKSVRATMPPAPASAKCSRAQQLFARVSAKQFKKIVQTTLMTKKVV